MKMAMTALAVVLLAQAGVAQAQSGRDRGERAERSRGEWRGDRAHGDGPRRDAPSRDVGRREGGRSGREAVAAAAPQAAPAPQAPLAAQAAETRGGRADRADRGDRNRSRVPGDSVGRPGPWTPNTGRGDSVQDRGRDRGDQTRPGRGADDSRARDRRDNDRRESSGRRDNDRRDWDRRDRRNDNHARWERGRYPSVYFSSHRYRYAWRPPSGYYAYSWSYGDFLPRSWYGPGYWLADPWRYDLPLPPPGFEWVRAGDDALLIDRYSGRIVQVVRNIFW